MLANEASVKELLKTQGFKGGRELIDKRLTFWTLTAWESDAAMRSFRNSEIHRKAMQKLPKWCDEAAYVHWLQDNATLPDWQTVHARMLAEGKTTKVKNPSSDHLLKNYPPPQWTASRPLQAPL
ncbi:MAG TPA: hypothetical protein VEC36_08265 [Patescibacteria group bacterium]|nr:hypothetical protein [Patescibacteria group bacterium]